MVWDFSRYNVVVKQVEGVSDLLRDVEKRVRGEVGEDDGAQRLLMHLRLAIRDLDVRAISMLADYDPVARVMLETGVCYDPRRDMFGQSFWAKEAAAEQQRLIEAPALERGKRRGRRRDRKAK